MVIRGVNCQFKQTKFAKWLELQEIHSIKTSVDESSILLCFNAFFVFACINVASMWVIPEQIEWMKSEASFKLKPHSLLTLKGLHTPLSFTKLHTIGGRKIAPRANKQGSPLIKQFPLEASFYRLCKLLSEVMFR